MSEYAEESIEYSKLFLIMWCCEGLEAVIDCDEEKKKFLIDEIKTGKPKFLDWLNQTLHMLRLRARFNPHRRYEIYSVRASDGISDHDLIQMFEDHPQSAAELIRARGVKIYSDRANSQTTVIT